MPPDFNELMFIYNWGISWTQYLESPDFVIGRLREFLAAKNSGEQRRADQSRRDSQIKSLSNGANS